MTRRAAAILALALAARPALGDGAAVWHVEVVGPWRVTALVAPVPPRAGPVEMSFMVQDASTGEPVLDAGIELRAWGAAGSAAARAVRGRGANRLLYAAPLALAAGDWRVAASITGPGAAGPGGTVAFEVRVGPAPPPWMAQWPWLAVPWAALALFGCHQTLAWRTGREKALPRPDLMAQ